MKSHLFLQKQLNYIQIMRLFSQGRYDKIEEDINIFPDKISQFFKEKGTSLLQSALRSNNIRPLKFIVIQVLKGKIAREIVYKCLADNDYKILKTYLGGQALQERILGKNLEGDRDMIEKFLLLFFIDIEDGIIKIFYEEKGRKYITESIEKNFRSALKDWKNFLTNIKL